MSQLIAMFPVEVMSFFGFFASHALSESATKMQKFMSAYSS